MLRTFSACLLLLGLLVPDVGGIFFPKPKERVRTVRKYVFVPVPVISHNTVYRVRSGHGHNVHHLRYLGTLNSTEDRELSGRVFYRLDDPSVLTVADFRYTNPGPDAFFWAGEEGGCDPASIDNKSYNLAPGRVGTAQYDDPSQPILAAYDGTQSDLVLRLPRGVTVRDLRWLCVWCRKFQANFGEIKFKVDQ